MRPAKVGEATVKPYKLPLSTKGLSDGPHALRVSATDSAGQKAHEIVGIVVNNALAPCDNPPTVVLVAPGDGDYVTGLVAVEAKASDDVGAAHVQLFVDGAMLVDDTSFPYKLEWDTGEVDETAHTLKAIAYDTSGKTGQHQIQLTVDRTPPVVSWVSPPADGLVDGDVPLVVSASDGAALAEVRLSVDGVELGAFTSAPFEAGWAAGGAAAGEHTLTASAVDAAGLVAVATRTVLVDRAPTAAIDAPADGSVVQGLVLVSATGEDDLGLSSMVLTLDGAEIGAWTGEPDTKTLPVEQPWDTTTTAYGEHTLVLTVTDGQGQTAVAEAVVLVDQPPGVDLLVCDAGYVTCTPKAPAEVTGTLYLRAEVSEDNAEVPSVTFEVDGQAVATVAAPYGFAWETPGTPDGVHTVTARAVTSLGDEATDSLTVLVNNCDLDHDTYLSDSAGCGGSDCADLQAAVHPGAADLVGDGADEDCDGLDGVDADHDLHASLASGGTDCDDGNAAIHPCADEVAGDGLDANCDGLDLPGCEDGDACTIDSCTPKVGCAHAPKCAPGEGCQKDGTCATLACGKAYSCLVACAPTNQMQYNLCLKACTTGVSDAETAKLDDYLQCQQGCAGVEPGDVVGCISTTCFEELWSCFYAVEGTATCAETQTCLAGCKDSTCTTACGQSASKAALKLELATEACVAKQCPAPITLTCQKAAKAGACSGAYAACAACGDVTYEGCCQGNTVAYCDGGLKTAACTGSKPVCGWSAAGGYYDCGTTSTPDPTGAHPMACPACVPQCSGKQCGPDGCGGICGTCPAGKDCIAGACAAPCGDMTFQGCCSGNELHYCENGLQSIMCAGAKPSCGWNVTGGYYDCGTSSAPDPSGVHPKDCDACSLPTTFPGATAHVTSMQYASPNDPVGLDCDSNGDGTLDAKDVSLNKAYGALTNGTLAKAIQEYKVIYLLELDPFPAKNTTATLLLGSTMATQPEPTCHDIGDPATLCPWSVDPASFGSDCKPLATWSVAEVIDGKLDTTPQDIFFNEGAQGLGLPVKGARLRGDVSGAMTLTNGRLCGTVSKQSIKDACAASPQCAPLAPLITGLFTCDPCGVVLTLEAKPTKGLSLEKACPTAQATVKEGSTVMPQTTLHLSASGSSSPTGAIAAWKWSVDAPAGSASVFLPSDQVANPTFEANVAGKYTFHLDVWDEAGEKSCATAAVGVNVIPDEVIHVELLWHTPNDPDETDQGPEAGSDMDLHFVRDDYASTGPDLDKDGKPDPWFDQPFDCFWFNAHPNWGSFDPSIDDDPGMDRDDTDGAGPEILNLNIPENTTYRIGVHYWSDHDYGPSYATLRIYIYSILVFEVTDVKMVNHDMWNAATIEWPSAKVTLVQKGVGYWITPAYQNPFFYQP